MPTRRTAGQVNILQGLEHSERFVYSAQPGQHHRSVVHRSNLDSHHESMALRNSTPSPERPPTDLPLPSLGSMGGDDAFRSLIAHALLGAFDDRQSLMGGQTRLNVMLMHQ